MIYNFQQDNEKWKNIKYSSKNHPFATVGTSGCGIFAVINAFSNMFNIDFEYAVNNFIHFAKESGARELEGTNIDTFLSYLNKKVKIPFLKYKNTVKTTNNIDECIKQFGVVIFLTGYDKKHIFSDNGHYCVIIGKKGNKYIVSDSLNYFGKINKYNRKKYLTPFENNTFLIEKTNLLSCIYETWTILPKSGKFEKSFRYVNTALNNGAYSSPSQSNLIGSFNKNQKVILTKWYDMWQYKMCEVYLRNGGKKHFINFALLSDKKVTPNKCVTAYSLNIYDNPKNVGNPSKAVETLQPLTDVELLSFGVYESNGYDVAKIKAAGKQYFCAKKYLKRK